jgi:hypothetical protein
MQTYWAMPILAACLASAAVAPACAQGALTPADTTLPDNVIEQRIRFIEEKLDSHKTHGQIWYWGWMGIDAGSAIGLGIIAGLDNHEDDAVNNGVNAGLGAIGVADLLLRPLEARHGADPIRSLPEETRDERIAKLRAGEEQMQRNAERASERTSVAMHAGNLFINGIAGVIVGLAGKTSDAIITSTTGAIGGEINIWTQPWGPETDWEDYKNMVGHRTDVTKVDVFMAALQDGATLNLRVQW